MPSDAIMTLLFQVPLVGVFCVIVFVMLKLFLAHIDKQATDSKSFIKEQRDANNEALKVMAVEHRIGLETLTKSVCQELDAISAKLHAVHLLEVNHDTFVKTAFRERFGLAVMACVEQAGDAAEVQAQQAGKK